MALQSMALAYRPMVQHMPTGHVYIATCLLTLICKTLGEPTVLKNGDCVKFGTDSILEVEVCSCSSCIVECKHDNVYYMTWQGHLAGDPDLG